MTHRATLAVATLLIACPLPAAGQAPRVSVEGNALVGTDTRDPRLPGRVRGGGLGVLFRISPRFSLGAEFDVPGTRNYGDVTARIPRPDGATTVFQGRRTFWGPTGAAIVRFHVVPRSRLDVALVAGLGMEFRTQGGSHTEDTVDASGVVRNHTTVVDGTSLYKWLQVPLGADAAIALSAHLSVVPEVRFYFDPLAAWNDGCCDGTHTRARLGLRWRF